MASAQPLQAIASNGANSSQGAGSTTAQLASLIGHFCNKSANSGLILAPVANADAVGLSAAHEIGTFSLKLKGPTPQEVTGKYLVVWEKVGPDWKLSADIWNEGN